MGSLCYAAASYENDLTGGERCDRRFFVSGDVHAFETFAEPYLNIGPVHAEQAPIMEL